MIEAESATLGKLVDLAVDGGRSFPFPRSSSPCGSDTCTSRELIAELTPVKRPVPVVGTVEAEGGAILRMRYGSSSWFWESVEGGDSTGLSG